MRSSRTPEERSSNHRPAIFFTMIAMAVIAGLAVTYFTQGFGPLAAKTDQPVNPEVDTQTYPAASVESVVLAASPTSVPPTVVPTPKPTSTPAPTATAAPTATPLPTPEPTVAPSSEPANQPSPEAVTVSPTEFLPDVDFGDLLGEGVLELTMPGGILVDAWYTFQLDTESRDITVFFALFDAEQQSLISTVRVDDYTHGKDLQSAIVTLYYENGSERLLSTAPMA